VTIEEIRAALQGAGLARLAKQADQFMLGVMPLACEAVTAGRPNPMLGDLPYKPYEQWDEQSKAELERTYGRWRLLFQLGNMSGRLVPFGGEDDDHWDWQLSELCDLWARGGLMYVWIERNRLASADFSNV
jgi:hypothetical protein